MLLIVIIATPIYIFFSQGAFQENVGRQASIRVYCLLHYNSRTLFKQSLVKLN